MPLEAAPLPGGCAAAARARLLRLLGAAGAIAIALLVAGFALFLAAIETVELQPTHHADGIVALTGGAERVADALSLLEEGHGERLLITGVNPNTNRDDLARHSLAAAARVRCCVDLGYRALNTIGNARETADWVQAHKIRSLIVVTSNYHMPRAMAEIAHALPGVDLQAYPVVSEKARHAPWWSDAQRVRVLAWEYIKYLAVKVRLSVLGATAPVSPIRTAG